MDKQSLELVEGRVCGECTVCCLALRIEEPSIRKAPGIPCRHLSLDDGCGIYADRPSVCKTWYCGWRRIGSLDEGWRPDRSRILLRFAEVPSTRKTLVIIEALDSDPSALASKSAVEFAMSLVSRSVTVAISVQTKPGYCNALIPVNKVLRPAVQMVDPVQGVARASQIMFSVLQHAMHAATDPERA